MEARARIALLRTDADVELAMSVRRILKGIPKEQAGQFGIVELCCTRPEEVLNVYRHVRPDLMIVIDPAEMSFFEDGIVTEAKTICLQCPVLVILPETRAPEALKFLKACASDYVLPPLRPWDLLPRVLRLLQSHKSEDELIAHLKDVVGPGQIVGQSPLLLTQLRKLPQIASCDATVLISGETGTGKELCARAIHYLSRRSNNAFVAVDAGAIPSELMENELFGHERGAYTSAPSAQHGLLQEAEGGTLFLDEIDTLSTLVQSKLLRFLQKKEYRPLGSPKTHHADVRVIAASNISLQEAMHSGRFRQDLYYRLNVLSLEIPPLRDRREDIPILAQHFLKKYADEFSRPARGITGETMKRLLDYSWPGNARELENLIERAVLTCDGPLIDVRDVELPVLEQTSARLSYQARKDLMVTNWERDELIKMLGVYRGNLSAIARAEGKDASAFRALLRKHHLRSDRTSPYWDIRA